MTALRSWLLALALTTLAVVVSYFWLDRPLALFIHNQLPPITRTVTEPLTHVPDPLLWMAAATFVALGVWRLSGRPLSKPQEVLSACSVSLMVAETIKNELKYVFGRTWPETWSQNNPSLIHDHVFGFNWFHGGIAYQSFPSGHMAATCALASVLWIFYPRLRVIYGAVTLAVLAGLVGANFHFLSDTFAGAFVGASVGLMTVRLLAQ